MASTYFFALSNSMAFADMSSASSTRRFASRVFELVTAVVVVVVVVDVAVVVAAFARDSPLLDNVR